MKRVIIDVDVGTDDAVALLLCLAADAKKIIKIEAITCVNGNTTVDNVVCNVYRILAVAKRTDIPVFKGASEPLLLPEKSPGYFHGVDGFGDLNLPTPDTSGFKKELAPCAIGRIAQENPKEIYLVAIGPLTNIALALKLFPELPDNLKEVYLMGGNHKAVGNTTRTAEFNFFVDPEAAQVVLEKVSCPLYIMTWEATLEASQHTPLSWVYETLVPENNPLLDLIMTAEKKIYKPGRTHWIPCDAFLMAVFLQFDRIVRKMSSFHACIELHGGKTRGQVVLDHLKEEKDNVVIVEEIDEDIFREIVLDAVKVQY